MRLGTRRANPNVPPALRMAEVKLNDLTSVPSLRAAIRGSNAIIHLAALNAEECARDPERALLVNTLGTLNLVRAAIDESIGRMIYFSTAHVYGAPLSGEIDELSVPRPAHSYSISHRNAEDYVLQASDAGRLSGTILRLSNAVGPPISADANCWMLLANDLSRQVVETAEIVLHSSGHQERNFVAIGDIVAFVEKILNSRQNEFTGQIINLGGRKSLTVLQLAQMIRSRSRSVLGRRPTIIVPAFREDVRNQNLTYRIDKARQFGFLPTVDIESEIDATLKMCREYFSK